MRTTLNDEYGDTGIVQPTACYEVRRDSSGRQRGPKPRDFRSYDEKQMASRFDDTVTDTQGAVIDGP